MVSNRITYGGKSRRTPTRFIDIFVIRREPLSLTVPPRRSTADDSRQQTRCTRGNSKRCRLNDRNVVRRRLNGPGACFPNALHPVRNAPCFRYHRRFDFTPTLTRVDHSCPSISGTKTSSSGIVRQSYTTALLVGTREPFALIGFRRFSANSRRDAKTPTSGHHLPAPPRETKTGTIPGNTFVKITTAFSSSRYDSPGARNASVVRVTHARFTFV